MIGDSNKINSVIDYLNYSMPEYNWRFKSFPNEIGFSGTPRANITDKVNALKKIQLDDFINRSNTHPWYEVPIGVDPNNNDICWSMFGTGDRSSSNILIAGKVGSGKSNIEHLITRHLMHKRKECYPQFLILSPSRSEFGHLKYNDSVKIVDDLDGINKEIVRIENIMQDRLSILNELEIAKGISSDCKIDTKGQIIINNRLFHEDDIVDCKDNGDDEILQYKAKNLVALRDMDEDAVPRNFVIDTLSDGYPVTTELDIAKIDKNGKTIMSPIIVILDNYDLIVDDQPRENIRKVDSLSSGIQRLSAFGRMTNIHLVFSVGFPKSNSITASLRNNIGTRIVCRDVDSNCKIMLFDGLDVESPNNLGYGKIYINGELEPIKFYVAFNEYY